MLSDIFLFVLPLLLLCVGLALGCTFGHYVGKRDGIHEGYEQLRMMVFYADERVTLDVLHSRLTVDPMLGIDRRRQ